MTRSVRIVVSGRVQGVYFRKFTKHKADDIGIVGTVRNTEDGKVEIIAQADAATLDIFIDWCRKGPITARVDKVDINELTGQPSYHSFDIV